MFHFSKSKHLNFILARQAMDELANRLPQIKKRRKIKRVLNFIKYFFLSLAALFLLLLILFSAKIYSLFGFYDQAVKGKANLEQAITLGQENKYSGAMVLAKAAEKNFEAGIYDLNEIKNDYFINKIGPAQRLANDAESLLITAQFLSKAVYGGANFGKSLEGMLNGDEKLNFSQFSPEEKHKILGKIYFSAPELNGIKADLDLAYLNLEQIRPNGALFFLKDKISEIKLTINETGKILERAVPLSELLPALAGYPQKARYLIVLQNNDELRPSGGFLGTYGILEIYDGEIISLKTQDIYHLDMPVKDRVNIEPPPPIKKYLAPKWYLRDANWSPDWPTSAQKINWFYQLESRLNPVAPKITNFDGIIALTPKLIMDFLKITGPATVEGQTYDENNFQDLLQYRVEKGYVELGVSSWQRKEVIGEIAKEVKIKIFDLPPIGWHKTVNAALDNLLQKNLLIYLSDSRLESIVKENGWAGEVKEADSDYVMAVDANMGALKTDAVMERGLEYKVSQSANGLFSKLTLSYAHQQEKTDWKTSAYKSYTRIYAPLGSELIKISGYEPKQIDSGREFNKTWFGFYLTVEPGKIKNIVAEYKLPPQVLKDNKYGLYLQKQPGNDLKRVSVDLSLANNIKSYNPASLSMLKSGANRIKWEGDLSMDREFEINF